ncbi:hypothetical protein WICPIJ_005009 [Wickerhamomyces pijperi]|uniref:Uncharacterized protein n=1 Tax=Wickerhamomyces pijperi TaxID=599730 RepID=A0A9P8Q4W7_WICPI|nr:hypothetical protein WICPIJ_005009 [Wickerhamomyces pijperi]
MIFGSVEDWIRQRLLEPKNPWDGSGIKGIHVDVGEINESQVLLHGKGNESLFLWILCCPEQRDQVLVKKHHDELHHLSPVLEIRENKQALLPRNRVQRQLINSTNRAEKLTALGTDIVIGFEFMKNV